MGSINSNIVITIQTSGTGPAATGITNIGTASAGAASAVSLLQGALATLVGSSSLAGLLDLVSSYQQMENQLIFVTNGQENLKAVTADLFGVAENTRTSFEDTVVVYDKLALVGEKLGLSQSSVLNITQELNEILQFGGTEAAQTVSQFTRLAASLELGSRSGVQLISVFSRAPIIFNLLSEQMGLTAQQLRTLGAAGKISATQIFEALEKAAPEIAADFAKTTGTISQEYTKIRTAFQQFTGTASDQNGVLTTLDKGVESIVSHMKEIGPVIIGLTAAGTAVGSFAALKIAMQAIGYADLGPIGLLVTGAVALAAAFTSIDKSDPHSKLTQFANDIQAIKDQFTPGFIQDLKDFNNSLGSVVTRGQDIGFVQLVRQATSYGVGKNGLGGALSDAINGKDVDPATFQKNYVNDPAARAQANAQAKLLTQQLIDAIRASRQPVVTEFQQTGKQAFDAFTVAIDSTPLGLIFDPFVTAVKKTIADIKSGIALVVPGFAEFKPEPGTNGGIDYSKLSGSALVSAQIGQRSNDLRNNAADADTKSAIAALQEAQDADKRNKDASDAAAAQKESQGVQDIIDKLKEQGDAYNLVGIAKRDYIELLKIENSAEGKTLDLENPINAAARQEVLNGIDTNEQNKIRIGLLDQSVGAMQLNIEKQGVYNELIHEGGPYVAAYSQDLAKLQEEAALASNTLAGGFVAGLKAIQIQAGSTGAEMSHVLTSAFDESENALIQFVNHGKANFQQLTESILQSVEKLLLNQLITKFISLAAGGLPGLGGSAAGPFAGGTPAPSISARATGGPVSSGSPYLVGEHGPEIFTPSGSGNIIPNINVGGSTPQFHVHIVNVTDPREISQHLSSPEGQSAIINAINRNPRAVRQAIGA